MLRRYEAVKRQQQKKDELEAAAMHMHVEPSNPGESDQILELSEMPTRNDPPSQSSTSQSSRVSDPETIQVEHKVLH